MTTAPPGFNYAKAYGIESVAGAVIFAIIYAPLLALYIRQAIVRPTYVFVVIALFCAGQLQPFVLQHDLTRSFNSENCCFHTQSPAGFCNKRWTESPTVYCV